MIQFHKNIFTKKNLIAFFCFNSLLLNLTAQNSKTNQNLPSPFEPPIVKAFADSLFAEGFLLEAENEYKRYLFCTDDYNSSDFQSTIYTLSAIYKSDKNVKGINWLNNY